MDGDGVTPEFLDRYLPDGFSDAARLVPLLVVDIDGTVREGPDDALGHFVNGPDDVRVFPMAYAWLGAWKDAGGRIVGVSNQGGIALGYCTAENVRAAMDETQRQCGYLFDRLLWCPHHPDAPSTFAAACACRKPGTGMIVAACVDLATEHHEWYPPAAGVMVGDRPEDEACATAAGFPFMAATTWRQYGALPTTTARR